MRKIIFSVLCALLLAAISAAAEETESTFKLKSYMLESGYKAEVTGEATSAEPIQNAIIRVYNKNLLKYDIDETITLNGGSTLTASKVNEVLLKKGLTSGEKELQISLVLTDKTVNVYTASLYVTGTQPQAVNSSSLCSFKVNRSVSALTDGLLYNTNKIGKEGVKITLPSDFGGGTLELDWRLPPKTATIEYYDSSNKLLGADTIDNGFYVNCYEFGANVAGIFVYTPDEDASLANLALYKYMQVPSTVMRWEEVKENLDILFIATHQDDEFLFFGGAIPYYCHTDANVAVMYTADCGVNRYYEAMSALWVSGLKSHPIFVGYPDYKAGSLSEAQRVWARTGDIVEDVVEQIRKYKPKVIVTQDEAGEYGHFQHILTVDVVQEAVTKAADPACYPESYEKYGAWQTQKLYIHLYDENTIYMDWTQELPGLGGINSIELATVAYNRNISQLKDFSMEKQGVKYDNTKFGLYYTTVGEDVLKNDFLENVE